MRGEMLTNAGSVNTTPHLALRCSRLSTDGFNTEIDDQNIFPMPVSVMVSADIEIKDFGECPQR
ncbi:hypothetical protein [Sutterella wadsworthensis]|uniref:hypothetical protein n=2 Tax=Sutterella wadsworthensis TaxID=40545 RepID=UPI0032C1476E